jgi:hypothetical protein
MLKPSESSPARARTLLRIAVLGVACVATLASAAATAAAPGKPSLAGIWFPDAARSERMPQSPPYTTEGKEIVDSYRKTHHPTKDDPGAFCVPPGMPSIALGGADYPVEILETPSQVTILQELHQQVRRIFLNAKHPEDFFPQRNGHSIGRWEGDVLVVDTIGIRAVTFGSVPHSERAHVIERWRRIDNGASLVNEVTIDDPKMYSKPIVLRQYYRAAEPGARMMEYDCTERLWADHEKSIGLTPGQ